MIYTYLLDKHGSGKPFRCKICQAEAFTIIGAYSFQHELTVGDEEIGRRQVLKLILHCSSCGSTNKARGSEIERIRMIGELER